MPNEEFHKQKMEAKITPSIKMERPDTSVPAIPVELMEWMTRKAQMRGDMGFARNIKELIQDNIMECYHADEQALLDNMMASVEAKNRPICMQVNKTYRDHSHSEDIDCDTNN